MKLLLKSILFISAILLLISFVDLNKDDEQTNKRITSNHKMIFAHRGLPYLPENTWENFEQSKAVGFKSIETDVQMTKDNKLVIFHDKNANRLLGITKNINELKWSDVKQQNIIYDSKTTSHKILSLEELLKASSQFDYIYLDMKLTNKSIADSLIVLLNKYQAHENVLIADANILFLAYIKYQCPKIKTVLEGFNKGKEWTYYFIPESVEPDYWASFFNEVDDKHIEFLNKKNLLARKIVYGIDKKNTQKALEMGLQHLIVDYHPSIQNFLSY